MKHIKEDIINAVIYYQQNKESITNVAKKYNIDRHVLSKYLKENLDDIIYVPELKEYVRFSDEENIAIEKYKNGEIKSRFAAAKSLGIHTENFTKMCEYKGISYSKANYKHTFNRNAFSEIVTEEDAYILGFILADGYLCETKNSLRFKLHSRDEDILIKINSYLESDMCIVHSKHQITGNPQSALEFNDKNLVENIKKYGIFQGKSGKEVFYKDIPKHLMRHYIRGIFDGDGYVSKDLSGTGVCGSKDVCENIRAILQKELHLNFGNKYPVSFSSSHIYNLKFCGETARKIVKYLYEDSNIYIDRKYNLAKQIFML